MKQKIIVFACIAVLVFGGCSKGETEQPEKNPVKNEEEKELIIQDEEQQDDEIQTDSEENSDETEEMLEVYYIDEATGAMVSKLQTVTGDISKEIVSELKKAAVLSDACELEVLFVNEEEEKLDLSANTGFGDYIRSMGTSGSEMVLECVVRTYSEAYDCDGVKITENGNPLETGHAVLDGYINYN